MDSRNRYKTLTTGRGGELRNLVQRMTGHPDLFPTKSELKAALAEVYPGAEQADLRGKLFDKLTELAKARAAGGYDVMELRGIGDELVLKVETTLANEDRLLPADDEDEVTADEAASITQAAFDAYRIGPRPDLS